MRNWLWIDLLNVVGVQMNPNGYFYIILSVLGAYTVCTLIDLIRINFIEKLFFYRGIENLNKEYIILESKICEKLHVEWF